MEVIVEIGDESTRTQIENELDFLLIIAESIDPPLIINRVIVPLDFEAKVNELQGMANFKSKRGAENAEITVAAKIIESGDCVSIVLSPFIYLSTFDLMIRCFILTHELAHILNKRRFPDVPTNSFVANNYLGNLYILFDEYFADRFAFMLTEKIFTLPSEPWKLYNENGVLGYLEPANDLRYYELIQSEIKSFRNHGDVNRYWNSIIDSVHVVSISTAHGFARYHQYMDQYKDIHLPNSKFFNIKTFALMDYFKIKFENGQSDLSDGVDLIADYFTNFGVKFEDRLNGGYIYVLDI